MKRSWLKRGTKQLKRTPLRRVGKQGKINIEANQKLREIYEEKGITECEIRLPDCLIRWALGFAHRHKRNWYKTHIGLDSFVETVMACTSCHNQIEHNEDLTERVFKRLRPKNEIICPKCNGEKYVERNGGEPGKDLCSFCCGVGVIVKDPPGEYDCQIRDERGNGN